VDTKIYHLDCQLTLKPVWHSSVPDVVVSFNNNIVYSGELSETTTFNVDQHLPPGNYNLTVEFTNKTDSDTDLVNNKDKLVIVEKIVFNSIESPKFIWSGIYTPVYPKLWATEQESQGIILESHLRNCNHLGWNGKWTLTFSMPIFTWIHQTENLGWIYS